MLFAVVYLIYKNLQWKFKFEKKVEEFLKSEEERIRRDAIERSARTLSGKTLEKLVPFLEKPRTFQSISRYPTNDRDIALIVDADLPAQKIRDIIQSYPQVCEVTLFDVYQGEQVPPGKKSLAFALCYQSMDKTLTDEEVDKLQQKILDRLQQEVGAVLR